MNKKDRATAERGARLEQIAVRRTLRELGQKNPEPVLASHSNSQGIVDP
jgi:hypothetical protein